MNQELAVIKYMQEHGGITTYEASQKLGVTRLSAVIFNLKEKGWIIGDERIVGKNRFGTHTSWLRYYIIKKPRRK